MPMELRKLFFGTDEVKAAVVDFCLFDGIPLPDGGMESFAIGEEFENAVMMKFDTRNPAHPDTIVLDRDQVAAALVRYCNAHDIPIPRVGQKAFQPEADGIALMINIHWKKKPASKA